MCLIMLLTDQYKHHNSKESFKIVEKLKIIIIYMEYIEKHKVYGMIGQKV